MMGQLILAFTSLGTLLLTGATTFVALLSTRTRRRLDARSRAGMVFARLEESPNGRAVWVLENRGEHEIYHVRLEVPDSEVSFESLSPGERRVTADESLLESREILDPVLTFEDDEGRKWRVGKSGVTESNEGSEKREVARSLTATTLVTLIATIATLFTALASILISLQR
ncbi:hypothetical protein ACFV0T_09260 [Streptomyces sp. NPDC059582]|uniref:hypothetical protein n=1 Tax=Streptomyces sp. NPDC059582 TaxID=3346875 RepID=UPI0036BCE48A